MYIAQEKNAYKKMRSRNFEKAVLHLPYWPDKGGKTTEKCMQYMTVFSV